MARPGGDVTCECGRCRAARAGLGDGPYTPTEFAALASVVPAGPSDLDVSQEPGVVAARAQLEGAAAHSAKYEDAWRDACIAQREAQLAVMTSMFDTRTGRRLPDQSPAEAAALTAAVREAREAWDDAHRRVAKARDDLLRAEYDALVARMAAARRGRR